MEYGALSSLAVNAFQPLINADPQNTISIFIYCADQARTQAIGIIRFVRQVLKRQRLRREEVRFYLVQAGPNIAFPVLEQGHYTAAGQAVGIVRPVAVTD